MKLSKIALWYLKACLRSWLNDEFDGVYMTITDGTQVQLAAFYKGRQLDAPDPIPSTVPESWLGAPDEDEEDK